jgi:hypothetical protein
MSKCSIGTPDSKRSEGEREGERGRGREREREREIEVHVRECQVYTLYYASTIGENWLLW